MPKPQPDQDPSPARARLHRVANVDASRMGAFGLHLEGLEAARELLVPSAPSWPSVRVSWNIGQVPQHPKHVDEDRADLPYANRLARVEIDRLRKEILFTFPEVATGSDVVHPFLSLPALIWAWWLGRDAFHAGVFEVGGGAWALVGEKGRGKSSTLASLAKKGVSIVADDILVLAKERALAGPRCIDLRRDAAMSLAIGDYVGVVGARERWRYKAGSVSPETPLRGWIDLAWGDQIAFKKLSASVWLPRLFRNRAFNVIPADPLAYLELAALPSWELARPRSLASLDESTDRLLQLLSHYPPPEVSGG